MRPESIRQFDYFYLGSIAVAVANIIYQLSQLGPAFLGMGAFGGRETVEATALPVGLTIAIIVVSVTLAAVIPLVLWYFASRKASQVARWLVVVLGVFGGIRLLLVLFMLGALIVSGMPTPDYLWLTMLLTFFTELLHMAAIAFLFPREAREWFARGGTAMAAHEDIFS
jgi:hypothetical protein